MVDSIVGFLSNPAFVTVLAFVLELVLRLVKSEKPLSIMRGLSLILKGAIKVALSVDALLDKVIPQNAAAPVEAPKA